MWNSRGALFRRIQAAGDEGWIGLFRNENDRNKNNDMAMGQKYRVPKKTVWYSEKLTNAPVVPKFLFFFYVFVG